MTEQEAPFTGVPTPLRANLERRGFTDLTPIQRAVVDSACEGRNLRLSSQTGSGKTIALGFALYAALTERADGVRALVIVPTRELARQVESELNWLFEGCAGVRSLVVTGGSDVRTEQRRLREKPNLVVGTPGRLLDHVRSGTLQLGGVREVVLDEADQMLDMGFKDELDALVAQLPAERRSHLVSATFPEAVKRLAGAFQTDALQLQGTALGQANVDIEHIAHLVHERDRYAALVNVLLANLGRRALVFVQKRVDAAQVAEMLGRDGFSAMPLSGDLPQAQRNRTLDAFKSGTIDILVATDVAARGLHVDDVALVIHGEIPREAEVYTHRSGRTGRAGQKGQSILLVVPAARRRTESMLQQTRVQFKWAPLPTPEQIRRTLMKKARRSLHELLARVDETRPTQKQSAAPDEPTTSGEPSATPDQTAQAHADSSALLAKLLPDLDFEYAKRLIEHHAPEKVIAVLLALSQTPLPTEPRAVVEPPLHLERRPPAWQTHRAPPASNYTRAPRKRPPLGKPGYARDQAQAGPDGRARRPRKPDTIIRRERPKRP